MDERPLADLLVAVSLAADLAAGLAQGQGLARTVAAARTAEEAPADVFHVALLWNLGATATATERSSKPGSSGGRRVAGSLRAAEAEAAGRLAARLGVSDRAAAALGASASADAEHLREVVRHADVEASIGADLVPLRLEILSVDPAPDLLIGEGTLEAIADFTDLTSPFLLGHSRRVAKLATAAASSIDVPGPDQLGMAGLVHDVGRVGISASIWNKADALDPEEMEQVRLHPAHTHRILDSSEALRPLAAVASAHHECLNGRGYHLGRGAEELTMSARLLAAADDYAALTERRPHRPAMDREQADRVLRHFVDSGCLDGDAVSAVLGAGEGLASASGDENQLVRLAVYGTPLSQVARQFGWTRREAKGELAELYERFGVGTRGGLALAALERGMLVG